jgi:outer membrane immunogenic protein
MRSTRSEWASDQGTQTVTGGAGGTTPFTDNIGLNASTTDFRGGRFLGFNYQFGQIVTGIEGSFGYAKQPVAGNLSLLSLTPSGLASVNTTWDSAVRGRLGYLILPNVLVFAAGGAAWQHIDANLSCSAVQGCGPVFTPLSVSSSFNKLGWTAGGGLEVAFTSNWFARAEYRYADFGSVGVPVSVTGTQAGITIARTGIDVFKLQTHTATFGLAYKFGI